MKNIIKKVIEYFKYRNKVSVYEILIRAKMIYERGSYTGMCACIQKAICDLFEEKVIYAPTPHCSKLKLIIPEFNSVYLTGRHCLHNEFWWDSSEISPRLEAFDILIKIYEVKNKYISKKDLVNIYE